MFHISDFRYALRLLSKSPGFTLMTILVLAGGLAISIYTYALLNTMLYKALPIADGGAVVRILGDKGGRIFPLDTYELSEMRASELKSLGEVGAYTGGSAMLSDHDTSRSVTVTYAEWNIFEFSHTKPLLGRGFVPNDNIEGAEPVVVLGYKIWQSVFAGDPSIIDKVVNINRKPTRVIGVMPKGYSFPISDSVWQPISNKDLNPPGYSKTNVNAYARLRPSFSAKEASAELGQLLHRVQQQHPRTNDEKDKLDGVFVLSFQTAQTYPEGPFIFAVLNVVSLFILLLACVNVGNMLLARTNERVKEIAIRVALGAPRLRLMIQMMLESAIICIVGGGFALLLAGWMLRATNGFLNSTLEGDMPYWWSWGLDGGTLLITAAFVVIAIVLVSVLPTYSATSVSSNALLRDGTRGALGRTSGRISRALVTVEIVLISVVMVIGSAMATIAYRAAHIDYGMDTANLVTMPVELTGEAYDTPEKQLLLYQRLLTELRHDDQVEAAIATAELGVTEFAIGDIEYNTASDYPEAALIATSETPVQVGTKLIEGRYFESRDTASSLKTVLISQSMAKRYWPNSSAIGRRISLRRADATQEQRVVIGVISDVRRGGELLGNDANYASLYIPLSQSIVPALDIVVRHRGNEAAARSALFGTVERIDPYIVLGNIVNYSDAQKKMTVMATTMTDVFIRCGIFALLLAMTGIYGLSSNAIVQRTYEIGLRRAIGASDGNIIGLFLVQGIRQLTVGLLISALISIVVLFAVSAFAGVGALTLAIVGVLVAAAVSALVLVAIYISTRRAVRYEPNVALRYE